MKRCVAWLALALKLFKRIRMRVQADSVRTSLKRVHLSSSEARIDLGEFYKADSNPKLYLRGLWIVKTQQATGIRRYRSTLVGHS